MASARMKLSACSSSSSECVGMNGQCSQRHPPGAVRLCHGHFQGILNVQGHGLIPGVAILDVDVSGGTSPAGEWIPVLEGQLSAFVLRSRARWSKLCSSRTRCCPPRAAGPDAASHREPAQAPDPKISSPPFCVAGMVRPVRECPAVSDAAGGW